MRKTINDFASYLKSIIVPETKETYEISSELNNIANEESLREGIRAFRSFLIRLCDILISDGERYDSYKKVAHEYENRITLSVNYSFLDNVKQLLMNIGFYGVLTKDNQSLTCNSDILNKKLSNKKIIETLNFLNNCGLTIEGINLNDQKQDLNTIDTIILSYPLNPIMLVGLKTMSIAEKRFGTLTNQDIFLRCDFRAIKRIKIDSLSILTDTIITLPADIQNYVIDLHERYIKKGCKCVIEIKGFWIYFKYTYKRKDLFGINASCNNGFHINVKAQNMDKYTDTIETLPDCLKDIITSGFGCRRKRFGQCDGGCRGMPIALDSSILDIRQYIEIWFDKEIEFM